MWKVLNLVLVVAWLVIAVLVFAGVEKPNVVTEGLLCVIAALMMFRNVLESK